MSERVRERVHHLPDLQNVVLRDTADDPWLIGVPREVRYLGRVSTMNELKMKREREIEIV